MHYLTRQRLHISQFHPLMKVLMTLYIVSVGAALWVAVLKYTDRAEWSTEGVRDYVDGSESAVEDDPFGDPLGALEEGYAEGKSRREIVDIAHPHLFTVPIVIFILGHLLHLTRLPDVLKLLVNAAAFLAFMATFLLPFLLVDDASLASAMFISGWVLLVSFVLLCLIPLLDMWFGKPGKGFDAIPKRKKPAAAGDAA